MKAACLRSSSLPGASQLFSHFLYEFDRVRPFYGESYLDPTAWARAAAKIQFPDDRRAAIVEALREQNGDSESLRKLAQPGTVAVVTGQQVGLFGGPAYTIYKAQTAVALAARLTAEGIPAVPVFWLATEDHDFPEINHAYHYDGAHQPQRLSVEGQPALPSPVGGVVPPSYPVTELAATLSGPYTEQVMTIVGAAYAPGKSLGEAFLALMRALMPDSGLLYLDPLHNSYRAVAAPFLADAVQRSEELGAALIARNEELAAAGYHTQVHVEDSTSLFFTLHDGQRKALKRKGNTFTAGKKSSTAAEMAVFAAKLSPNALLRPVMQDYTLPTISYVGGPGEIAYFAQSQVLYERLLGRMPVITARSGFTLIDTRCDKLLMRYKLQVPDVFGEAKLHERISKQLVPAALQANIASATRETEHRLDRLKAELAAFDPTLAAAVENSRAKIIHHFTRIEAKTLREALRRDSRAASEAAYLSGTIYPDAHLQERHYTILPFLAEHGLDLIAQLGEHVHIDCPDHIVVHL
jgi:bacillithiol synthase